MHQFTSTLQTDRTMPKEPEHTLAPTCSQASDTTRDLVHLAQEGSQQAFAALWSRVLPGVRRMLQLDLSRTAIESELAEIVLRRVSKFEELPPADARHATSSFRAWLCGIARNLRLSHHRKRGRRPHTDADMDRRSGPPQNEDQRAFDAEVTYAQTKLAQWLKDLEINDPCRHYIANHTIFAGSMDMTKKQKGQLYERVAEACRELRDESTPADVAEPESKARARRRNFVAVTVTRLWKQIEELLRSTCFDSPGTQLAEPT